MNGKVEILNSDDVVSLTDDEEYHDHLYYIKNRFDISKLFEFEEFTSGILRVIGLSSEAMKLLQKGIPCRVMTTQRTGWRFGKIRLKIELQFIPDQKC